MTASSFGSPDTLARLVNVRWGYTSIWVRIDLAIEQFAAHRPELQEGILIEWREGDGKLRRLDAVELRRVLRSSGGAPGAGDRARTVDLQSE